jgi:hypothetical protein
MDIDGELDLNIDNYVMDELVDFFQLPEGYTEEDIWRAQGRLLEKSVGSKSLMQFVHQGTRRLMQSSSSSSSLLTTQSQTARPVVDHGAASFVYTSPSPETFAGKINPLNKRTITQCMTLDTRILAPTNLSDFYVPIRSRLTRVTSMEVERFVPLQQPLPVYSISSQYGNNFFTLSITGTDLKQQQQITEIQTFYLPDGNYTPAGVVTLMNQAIQQTLQIPYIIQPEQTISTLSGTQSGGTTTSISNVTIPTSPLLIISNSKKSYLARLLVSLNANTTHEGPSTVTISYIPNNQDFSLINFGINFIIPPSTFLNNCNSSVPLAARLGATLGFHKEVYQSTNIPNNSNNQYIIAESPCMSVKSLRYVYLSVDDFNNHMNPVFIPSTETTFSMPSLVAQLDLDGVLNNNNNNNVVVSFPKTYFGPVDIQRLRISLYDEFGRPTSIGGFYIILKFQCLYDI